MNTSSQPARNPLSERQLQILGIVRAYHAKHGRPATIREIGVACGLRSAATVHAHLSVLERHGRVVRRHGSHRCWFPV